MTASETMMSISGLDIPVWQRGEGPPLLVLHRDFGDSGLHAFLERLSANFTVIAPVLPGFSGTDRPDWARNVRDLGALVQWLIRDLGLKRPSVLGLGFGGWIAAEMATLAPDVFEAMVLVSPVGIKPRKGEIYDQFLVHSYEYIKAGFHDPAGFDAAFGAEPDLDQLEAWDISREMTSRVAWKPYLYNVALPPLLAGCAIPSLIVWGDDDRIVPLEVGETYAASLRDARLEVVSECGHLVELEAPERLADLVGEFLIQAR